jgi:hypothetical protein
VWGKPAASHRWRSFSFFLTRAAVAWERHRGGVQLGCTLTEEEEEGGPRRRTIWRGGGGEGGPVPAGRAHRGYERWSVQRYC